MTYFIETERLYINEPTLSDIDNWQILHSDSETMKYLGGVRDRSTTMQWLEADILHYKKHGFCLGSAFAKDNSMFVGRAGLVYLNYDETQHDVEIGYELKQTCWNQGYGTELVQAIIRWGFDNLSTSRLIAVTRPENKKSQYVLEKAKMHYEKTIQIHKRNYLLYVIYK